MKITQGVRPCGALMPNFTPIDATYRPCGAKKPWNRPLG